MASPSAAGVFPPPRGASYDSARFSPSIVAREAVLTAPDRSRPGLTRRAFLGATAVLAGAAGAAAVWLRERRPAGAGAMRRDLTEPELRDLAALALVLFPPTDRVPADLVRSTARGWVQGRMRRMRFPPPYRAGLTELAEAARSERDGSRFAALARGDAERAVARLWDDASGAFGELAADLLEGLYTSLPGWRLVGYPAGPGAPAGTRAYTEAPDPA